jgi:hypothetical protein
MVTNHRGASSQKPFTSRGWQTVSTIAHTTQQAAASVGGKAEDAAFTVGYGLQSLADAIRDKGPHEGVLGGVAASLAKNLESGGTYLQQKGLHGIAGEATNLIRRNPVPALFVGVGLGCLIAHLTARS